MNNNIYYTVVQIELPEYVTGTVTDIESFKNIEDAIKHKDDLQNVYPDDWYDVIVNTMPNQQ